MSLVVGQSFRRRIDNDSLHTRGAAKLYIVTIGTVGGSLNSGHDGMSYLRRL